MSFKCVECGHIFEEGEQAKWIEPHGENVTGCPICEGAYEETRKCVICGAEHLENELNGGVCNECISEYRKDFDTCYAASVLETQEIKINALLASLFEPSDIEQILVEFIRDKIPDIDCSQFIDSDISWFGEKLAEEVKKNENAKV